MGWGRVVFGAGATRGGVAEGTARRASIDPEAFAAILAAINASGAPRPWIDHGDNEPRGHSTVLALIVEQRARCRAFRFRSLNVLLHLGAVPCEQQGHLRFETSALSLRLQTCPNKRRLVEMVHRRRRSSPGRVKRKIPIKHWSAREGERFSASRGKPRWRRCCWWSSATGR